MQFIHYAKVAHYISLLHTSIQFYIFLKPIKFVWLVLSVGFSNSLGIPWHGRAKQAMRCQRFMRPNEPLCCCLVVVSRCVSFTDEGQHLDIWSSNSTRGAKGGTSWEKNRKVNQDSWNLLMGWTLFSCRNRKLTMKNQRIGLHLFQVRTLWPEGFFTESNRAYMVPILYWFCNGYACEKEGWESWFGRKTVTMVKQKLLRRQRVPGCICRHELDGTIVAGVFRGQLWTP